MSSKVPHILNLPTELIFHIIDLYYSVPLRGYPHNIPRFSLPATCALLRQLSLPKYLMDLKLYSASLRTDIEVMEDDDEILAHLLLWEGPGCSPVTVDYYQVSNQSIKVQAAVESVEREIERMKDRAGVQLR